jgi:hypothetical protein
MVLQVVALQEIVILAGSPDLLGSLDASILQDYNTNVVRRLGRLRTEIIYGQVGQSRAGAFAAALASHYALLLTGQSSR